MNWPIIISTSISLLGLVIAFVSLNHRIQKDKLEHRGQIDKSLENAIGNLNRKLDLSMSELDSRLSAKIEKLEKKRSDDVNRLHTRVTELENRTFTTLLDRLSNMEGELKGISNIVRVLQERFMARRSEDL